MKVMGLIHGTGYTNYFKTLEYTTTTNETGIGPMGQSCIKFQKPRTPLTKSLNHYKDHFHMLNGLNSSEKLLTQPASVISHFLE